MEQRPRSWHKGQVQVFTKVTASAIYLYSISDLEEIPLVLSAKKFIGSQVEMR